MKINPQMVSRYEFKLKILILLFMYIIEIINLKINIIKGYYHSSIKHLLIEWRNLIYFFDS